MSWNRYVSLVSYLMCTMSPNSKLPSHKNIDTSIDTQTDIDFQTIYIWKFWYWKNVTFDFHINSFLVFVIKNWIHLIMKFFVKRRWTKLHCSKSGTYFAPLKIFRNNNSEIVNKKWKTKIFRQIWKTLLFLKTIMWTKSKWHFSFNKIFERMYSLYDYDGCVLIYEPLSLTFIFENR